MRTVLLAILSVLILISPVKAASQQDRVDCESSDLQKKIKGCTSLIEDKRETKQIRAMAYVRRGDARFDAGQTGLALEDYRQAITLAPDYGFARADFAVRLRILGHYEESIAQHDKSVELMPRAAAAYVDRALTFAAMKNYPKALADMNEALKLEPGNASFYNERGNVNYALGKFSEAIADFSVSNKLSPKDPGPLSNRATAYEVSGQPELARADHDEAVRIAPQNPLMWFNRGTFLSITGNCKEAIADFTEAIKLDPRSTQSYGSRGWCLNELGREDDALRDWEAAIRIDDRNLQPAIGRARLWSSRGRGEDAVAALTSVIERGGGAWAYASRGRAYRLLGRMDEAQRDFDEAERLDTKIPETYLERGLVREAQGRFDDAKANFAKALALPAAFRSEKEAQRVASQRLAALDPASKHEGSTVASGAASTGPEKRVALVIGNSAYQNAAQLKNPAKDAHLIAESLRDASFTQVIEKTDLDLAALIAELRAFGELAADADWAVIYIAGHGIEVGGTNYIVPVDAKLERADHVQDEALPLERVLSRVEGARKLRLVILDACRNNPFANKMAQAGTTRSTTRGLMRIEPSGGTFIAYAARDGTTAQDGDGENSPYANALARHIAEPGLDIRFLFDKVRDSVLKATDGSQMPFTYGSLPAQQFVFKGP
jgi:tetratricopeptide (TPR) repeat protein